MMIQKEVQFESKMVCSGTDTMLSIKLGMSGYITVIRHNNIFLQNVVHFIQLRIKD